MNKIQIEIPDGKKAEWVNGVLTLVDDKPIEYKFKVGDKVRDTNNPELIYTVIGQFAEDGEPMYNLKGSLGETSSAEKLLLLIPQRIKTLADAMEWCKENGKEALADEYDAIIHNVEDALSPDLLAYLKLRIITAPLNEGWEPTYGSSEVRWIVEYDTEEDKIIPNAENIFAEGSHRLMLRTYELAEYAAAQFADLYADFLGYKKGGDHGM